MMGEAPCGPGGKGDPTSDRRGRRMLGAAFLYPQGSPLVACNEGPAVGMVQVRQVTAVMLSSSSSSVVFPLLINVVGLDPTQLMHVDLSPVPIPS